MPPGTTCSPTSKDTTIVSGFIPLSGISPPNRQSAKPPNPVSTKSGEGHFSKLKTLLRKASERSVEALWTSERSVEALWTRIGELLSHFPQNECENYFRAA